MNSIESLLAELNANDFISNHPGSEVGDSSEVISVSTNDILEDDQTEFATAKKEATYKYSQFGLEIHKKLKANQSKSIPLEKCDSSGSKPRSTKSTILSAPSPSTTAYGKRDVYAEPIFGLRILNPLVSAQFIETKMIGKLSVRVSNIAFHLNRGDKHADWVFAGVIVFKSGMKTSQKGKQYCLWKISDLKNDLKVVTVYLFSNACTDLMKYGLGTVIAILNASPFNKEENVSQNDITLTVRNSDQVMIWGQSRDYGICKAKKKNGDCCTAFVNKSCCEFCLYHMKSEYDKFSSKRSDLFATSVTGPDRLRNKILGKNEVFYGGQSFMANKGIVKEKKLINFSNSVNPAIGHRKLIEADRARLDALSRVPAERLETCSETKSTTRQEPTNKNERSIVSRLHLFREAGKKMIETGMTTRVTGGNLEPKKKSDLSFSNMFFLASPQNSTISKPDSDDFEIELPSLNLKSTLGGKLTQQIGSSRNLMKTRVRSMSPTANSTKSTSSKNVTSSSKFLKNFSSLSSKSAPSLQKSSEVEEFSTSMITSSKNNAASSTNPCEKTSDQTESRISLLAENERLGKIINLNTPHFQELRSSDVSATIHNRKKIAKKMNAINVIKRMGGLEKNNPNRVKLSQEKKENLKRRLEEEEDHQNIKENSTSKPLLSERFIELMNATSNHEYLVKMKEDIEFQKYLNNMEKKEQLEEKMLNTYKIPCKAVSCLQCKYKWFSASDLCRLEGHPIKVIDGFKRFFKCSNCSHRTVSLEIIPLLCCQKCGSGRWSRTAMIREKVIGAENNLCIRGDEEKFIDSLSGRCSLNLLVPE